MLAMTIACAALAWAPTPAEAQSKAAPTKTVRPSARKPAPPIKPRKRVRPAAGQSSARPVPVPEASDAATARAYRKDAARHLYSLNLGSIYKGRMPPLLYAVGCCRFTSTVRAASAPSAGCARQATRRK